MNRLYDGFSLKFYKQERDNFPDIFKIELTEPQALLLINKLLRHFRVLKPYPKVNFYGSREKHGGSWKEDGSKITLPHNPYLGQVVHETAHEIETHKYGKSSHHKRLMKIITTVTNYCRKKGYVSNPNLLKSREKEVKKIE